jgi:Domain of unknown function (DUF4430)
VSGLPRKALLLLALASTLAGCGLGAGKAPSGVSLAVTQNFGSQQIAFSLAPKIVGEQTVMSLLKRNYTVGTRYGGGFVESIGGRSGGESGGRPVDWFYYVNGVEASKGAAQTTVHPGDHIWWDLHDWSQTEDVPAVVGSFPEPFLNGLAGKRLPVRVECVAVNADPCRTVIRRLRQSGVPVGVSTLAPGYAPDVLRVLVGPFKALSGDPSAQRIGRGPSAGGVYGRFSDDGRLLSALDGEGRTQHVLGAHTGLIAATSSSLGAPVWVITGTDAQGLKLAAGGLQSGLLREHFAVAFTDSGALPLPTDK